MDCMEAKALKSSLLSDIGVMKPSQQQGFVDDIWCVTGLNNVSCDDFSVDDLLDFSDKDFKDGPLKEDEDFKDTLSLSSSQHHHHHHHRNSNFSSFSETDDFGSLLAAELAVPAEEMENLEWLSQFVDDSRSEVSLLCPAGSFKDNKGRLTEKWSEPAVHMIRVPCFPLHVPVKPRSKRSRPNGRVWSGSPSLTTTESSSTSSSSYGSSALSPFILSNPVQDSETLSSVEKPPAKKQKKKPATDTGSGSIGSQTSRRCSHCQVNKTPQWRTGPLGPKTLCNACGVRYKSGRLFPEYRPACSPTFSQEAHSNSHRKVLEMRRKKEATGHVEAGLTPMVSSF
ncbi:GATA transcription factor 5-like [Coffea eugenioides]|uniref:GATA transcription factor 5-like n=1 Tax=Coffea eugenioides TaxID=49369 RepID=UPI000F614687|nr:GATA transcription factor 5-like [Coffea eugenioides]